MKPRLGREDLRLLRRRKIRGDRELRDDIVRQSCAFEDDFSTAAPDEDPHHPDFRRVNANERNR